MEQSSSTRVPKLSPLIQRGGVMEQLFTSITELSRRPRSRSNYPPPQSKCRKRDENKIRVNKKRLQKEDDASEHSKTDLEENAQPAIQVSVEEFKKIRADSFERIYKEVSRKAVAEHPQADTLQAAGYQLKEISQLVHLYAQAEDTSTGTATEHSNRSTRLSLHNPVDLELSEIEVKLNQTQIYLEIERMLVQVVMPDLYRSHERVTKFTTYSEAFKLLRDLRFVEAPFEPLVKALVEALYYFFFYPIYVLPRSLLNLKFLTTLSLSGTLIFEVPSSIGDVKSLLHLSISYTPVTRLPESIRFLHKLQTLKLRGCINLVGLPESIWSLHELQTLDVKGCVNLVQLPQSPKDLAAQALKMVPSETESLHELLVVKDSYSARTIDNDHILCQGSVVNLEHVHKRTRTQEEDSSRITAIEHPDMVKDVNEISVFNLEEKARHEVQVADEEYKRLPEHLKELLFLYCSLFPSDYEFRKYELVQLWIAEGFILEGETEGMEDTGIAYFNLMETEGFFVLSRCDFSVHFDSLVSVPIDNPNNFLYRVNPIKLSVLENKISLGDCYRVVEGKLDGEMTQHLSLFCVDIDEMIYGVLHKFKHLRTLLLLSGPGLCVKHVPHGLFLSLKFLRTMNLSGTLISELPSSIRSVKALRYLDASYTPIRRLPETIDSLLNLQTLKLRGCINFVQLPKGMKKLTNLRHIDLDIIQQLDSLPAHLGKLTKLQTLSAFLVGRDDGCHIGELKNLNGLKGTLHISRLENVLSKEEATEAVLVDKKCLQRLELKWSNPLAENIEEEEKILECLQPHFGLKELEIVFYGGSVLPTWISNPSFADLVVITLYKCNNLECLPSIGQLPALKFLSIIEMNKVNEINHQLFRNEPHQVSHAFPKLERLEVDIMLNLKEWKEVRVGDLPSLLKLTVDSCPELVTLPSLSCLKTLKHLEFRHCLKLMSLPSGGLPASLESFIIIDCPELKEQCHKGAGDWSKICHVPSLWFDHEEVIQKHG